MIDRKIIPEIRDIQYNGFPEYEVKYLSNGAKVYFIENKLDEAAKVEVLLPAGSSHQEKKLLSSFYAELLLTGTKEWSAQYISESMDHLGGFYGAESDKDYLSFQLYGLQAQIPELLSISTKAIEGADFPQKEFDKLLNIKRQKMLINKEKVSYRARKLYIKSLFGATPYGQVSDIDDFDFLTREDLKKYHEFVRLLQPTFFVVGKWTSSFEQGLENLASVFGDQEIHNIKIYTQAKTGLVHDEKDGAIQTAIRMGKIFPNPEDQDFYSLKVMSTLFGGYFGSRLMMNLREDKGLTYGIGTVIVPLQYAQYFAIATEVNAEQSALALNEIRKEIQKLQSEMAPDNELEMVKNYMIGQFLRSLDGSFALIERLKAKWKLGYREDYEENLLQAIRSSTVEGIHSLAQKYLSENDMLTVTAGKIVV